MGLRVRRHGGERSKELQQNAANEQRVIQDVKELKIRQVEERDQ